MRKGIATISLAITLLLPFTAAVAASPEFTAGVAAYNARHYGQAVAYLSAAASKAPNDALVHYYLGLSYQGVNQMTLAKQEYSFVASRSPNPQLRSQASLALSNLSRYSTTYSGYSASAATKVASAAGVPSSAPKVNGKLHILFFTADW